MYIKNILYNFTLAITFLSFIGCGGNDSSVNNTPGHKENFNYETELSKAPQVIQDAMNSHPIQYVSNISHLASFNKKDFSAKINISAIPTILSARKGYSFITVKIDQDIIGEGVYAWDKDLDVYPIGFRALSANNKTSSSVNQFDTRFDAKNISTNVNSKNCSAIADLLVKGNLSISLNITKSNKRLSISNIILGLDGTNQSLPNFSSTLDQNFAKALQDYLKDALKI